MESFTTATVAFHMTVGTTDYRRYGVSTRELLEDTQPTGSLTWATGDTFTGLRGYLYPQFKRTAAFLQERGIPVDSSVKAKVRYRNSSMQTADSVECCFIPQELSAD